MNFIMGISDATPAQICKKRRKSATNDMDNGFQRKLNL
jgi:hypothetical protein